MPAADAAHPTSRRIHVRTNTDLLRSSSRGTQAPSPHINEAVNTDEAGIELILSIGRGKNLKGTQ